MTNVTKALDSAEKQLSKAYNQYTQLYKDYLSGMTYAYENIRKMSKIQYTTFLMVVIEYWTPTNVVHFLNEIQFDLKQYESISVNK